MKPSTFIITKLVGKAHPELIRLAMLLVSLALFVMGSGAPEAAADWEGNRLILLVAIAGGLFAGLLRAGMRGRQLAPPHFRLKWLVLAAFILQWLAFIWPVTRSLIPDRIAGATLILSQVMLFVFVLANACQPGLKALGLGLALNFLVIASNDGFMPISPETIQAIAPHAAPGSWQVGQRLGGASKDIVLLASQTRLVWLSDCLLLPTWLPYRVAFSLGDVLIALGAFWALWALWATAGVKQNSKG